MTFYNTINTLTPPIDISARTDLFLNWYITLSVYFCSLCVFIYFPFFPSLKRHTLLISMSMRSPKFYLIMLRLLTVETKSKVVRRRIPFLSSLLRTQHYKVGSSYNYYVSGCPQRFSCLVFFLPEK